MNPSWQYMKIEYKISMIGALNLVTKQKKETFFTKKKKKLLHKQVRLQFIQQFYVVLVAQKKILLAPVIPYFSIINSSHTQSMCTLLPAVYSEYNISG